MAESPLLAIRDLHVRLPEHGDRPFAVEGVSLDVGRDEIVCLVGESGSGKTLTGRAIVGLLPGPHVRAERGEVRFDGEDLLRVSRQRLRELRGNEISMVFQEPMTALNPLMTIGRQIDELIQVHTDLPAAERRERSLEMFENVRLPDPDRMLGAYPHEISGGQRQRAMIAMALVLEPKVIIADEPTTALDVTTQAQILQLIKDLQGEHHTGVLYVTHDFGVVAEVADRVAVMQTGRLVEVGGAEQVLNAPSHPYTRSLVRAVPSLVPARRRAIASDESALETRRLNKTFRSGGGLLGGKARLVDAVKDVSLRLLRGETLGVVGESGSGKSTVARLIVRIVAADSGSVLLGGVDVLSLSASRIRPYRKRIQMVFQDPYGSLNPRHKVGRLIAEGMIVHGIGKAAAHERAAELLELVGLDADVAERFPHEFSGGQRQRIGIARALALDPEILVADEPVSALDVSVQAQVLDLLARIRDRLGLTMLFITHDLRVAAQVCDRIAVMHRGELVEHGDTAELFANPGHAYTRALLSAVPGRGWIAPELPD